MEPTSLHERIQAAADGRSFRHLADLTGTSAESVRRYMAGHSPSVEFLTRLCVGLGVSGEWMLTGRGAMRAEEARTHALREARPSDLLAAMAVTLEGLLVRMARVEVFVEAVESRLHALTGEGGREVKDATGPDFSIRRRSQSVADAIADGEPR